MTACQRLLALVAHNVSKSKWKWVPWKFRVSVAKEEDIQTSRSAKVPKLEGIHLHALLMDDPPSIDVTGGDLGLHAIRTMFEVFNNAVAMCEAAHLASLKSYTAKFMTYLTAKYEADSNLRAPTFLEAQAADKQIHSVICELVIERQWSLDQALHELTSIRADLPMLLQPRPKPVKAAAPIIQVKGPPKGPGKGKHEPAKGKGKGKQKGPRIEWVTEINQGGHKKQETALHAVSDRQLSTGRFMQVSSRLRIPQRRQGMRWFSFSQRSSRYTKTFKRLHSLDKMEAVCHPWQAGVHLRLDLKMSSEAFVRRFFGHFLPLEIFAFCKKPFMRNNQSPHSRIIWSSDFNPFCRNFFWNMTKPPTGVFLRIYQCICIFCNH